jgi:hypothetical protein
LYRKVEMNMSLRHFRRAFLKALTWAALWAPLGVLLGMIMDPDGSMDEPWIALGAYPGFLCGIVFCAVLGIVRRQRRLAEFSLSRVGAWGAVSGLLVMAPLFTGLLGTPNTEHALWQARYMIAGAVILLSSMSAIGSVLVARITPTPFQHR